MATKFSPCKGSYVLNQFPSNVMFGMNGFHVSFSQWSDTGPSWPSCFLFYLGMKVGKSITSVISILCAFLSIDGVVKTRDNMVKIENLLTLNRSGEKN